MKFDHAKLFVLLQVFFSWALTPAGDSSPPPGHSNNCFLTAKAILIAQLQHNGVQSPAITCTFVFSPYHPDEKQKGRTQTGRPTQEVNIGLLVCEFCLRTGARSKRGPRDPPLPARSFLRVMRSLAMCVNAASSAARQRTWIVTSGSYRARRKIIVRVCV